MTALRPCLHPVTRLVPQAPPMVLIDEVLGWNQDQVVTALTVRRDSAFVEERGAPAHVALEWIAQSCGALVGIRALEEQRPVRIGFILGTRDFSSSVSWFKVGDRLTITANSTYNDGEMAQFDCRVDRESMICATARLTLFQPNDLAAMLASQGITAAGSLVSGPLAS
jgi:predicted hotdog family 3-hydroxylacyl-ACP dehydratase